LGVVSRVPHSPSILCVLRQCHFSPATSEIRSPPRQCTVKEFNQALDTSVACRCLPCGNQRKCTQVQPMHFVLLATVEKVYTEDNQIPLNMPLQCPNLEAIRKFYRGHLNMSLKCSLKSLSIIMSLEQFNCLIPKVGSFQVAHALGKRYHFLSASSMAL